MPGSTELDTPRSSWAFAELGKDNIRPAASPNQHPPLSPPDSPEQTITLPKRVSDVLDLFRESQKGFRRAWWVELPLNPHEYDLLWDSLGKDDDLLSFVVDKSRYVKGLPHHFGLLRIPTLGMFGRFDWFPQDSTISVRMPTSIHDIFTEMVAEEIRSQLRDFKREHTETAAIVDKLTSETTSDVYLHGHGPVNGRLPKRSPDASFAHTESQYPSVVIETSYSRRQKDLARLADDYICGSDGNIAVVLGFDIEYGGEIKEAAISIWRPRIASVVDGQEGNHQVLEAFCVEEADVRARLSRFWYLLVWTALIMALMHQLFRLHNKNPVQNRSLELRLTDFAPSVCFANVSKKAQDSVVVTITYEVLCSFLAIAEGRDRIKRTEQGLQTPLPLNCKKRRRESTPPETLSPGREGRLAKREAEVAAKAEEADGSW